MYIFILAFTSNNSDRQIHTTSHRTGEEQFHENRYGFRSNRCAQQEILTALDMMNEGNKWIVDIDLEKFFDTVNHDKPMTIIGRFIEEKLGIKVNMTKSKVDKPQGLKYLGFGFYFDTRVHQFKAKPYAKSVTKFKKRIRELTCRSWGVSNSYKVEKLNQLIRGWINYFNIGSMKSLCAKTRRKYSIQTAYVYMEALENTTESSKEFDETWN